MQSSSGWRNSQLRASGTLAAIALGALALSLLLAFASVPHVQATVPMTGSQARTFTLPSSLLRPSGALWSRLAPLAIGVDVLAVLGLALLLVVRRR